MRNLNYTILFACLLFIPILSLGHSLSTGTTASGPVSVFTPGELGFPCIRIPSVVHVSTSSSTRTWSSAEPQSAAAAAAATGPGVLVAFAECRNWTGDGCYPLDFQHMTPVEKYDEMLMPPEELVRYLCSKKSTDGGKSWSDLKLVTGHESFQPMAVYDEVLKRIILQYNTPDEANWQITSSDDGDTWSVPLNITNQLHGARSWAGPGIGLQLTSPSSPHRGRLMFIGHESAYTTDLVWYSDDGGKTYQKASTPYHDGGFPKMDEAQLVETSNGTVIANMRNNHLNSTCKCRAFAISHDGGSTFGHIQYNPELISPVCQASILRAGPGNAIYFSNPASTSERINMTVRTSFDGGMTWPKARLIAPNRLAAYSCLVNINNQQLGLMWETNSTLCTAGSASCETVFSTLPFHSSDNDNDKLNHQWS
jgi:sialidase-1